MVLKGATYAGEKIGISKWLVEKFVIVSGKGVIARQSDKRTMCLVDEECERLLPIYKELIDSGLSPTKAISKMRIEGSL